MHLIHGEIIPEPPSSDVAQMELKQKQPRNTQQFHEIKKRAREKATNLTGSSFDNCMVTWMQRNCPLSAEGQLHSLSEKKKTKQDICDETLRHVSFCMRRASFALFQVSACLAFVPLPHPICHHFFSNCCRRRATVLGQSDVTCVLKEPPVGRVVHESDRVCFSCSRTKLELHILNQEVAP